MTKFLLYIIFLFGPNISLAIIGTAIDENVPESLCQINFLVGPEKKMALCSGVLIGPYEVLTAGHCIADYDDSAYDEMTIQCGFKSLKKNPQLLLDTPDKKIFKVQSLETHSYERILIDKDFNVENASTDLAIIILKTKSTLRPMLAPFNMKDPSPKKLKGIKCWAAGSGHSVKAINIKGAKKIETPSLAKKIKYFDGIPYKIPINLKKIFKENIENNYYSNTTTLKANDNSQVELLTEIFSDVEGPKAQEHIPKVMADMGRRRWSANSTMGGDSGGPLFCHINGNYHLYGITSALSIQTYKTNNPAKIIQVNLESIWAPYNIKKKYKTFIPHLELSPKCSYTVECKKVTDEGKFKPIAIVHYTFNGEKVHKSYQTQDEKECLEIKTKAEQDCNIYQKDSKSSKINQSLGQ